MVKDGFNSVNPLTFSVKKIYDIKLNKPSIPTENRKDEKFNYYYDLIWRDIDENI